MHSYINTELLNRDKKFTVNRNLPCEASWLAYIIASIAGRLNRSSLSAMIKSITNTEYSHWCPEQVGRLGPHSYKLTLLSSYRTGNFFDYHCKYAVLSNVIRISSAREISLNDNNLFEFHSTLIAAKNKYS